MIANDSIVPFNSCGTMACTYFFMVGWQIVASTTAWPSHDSRPRRAVRTRQRAWKRPRAGQHTGSSLRMIDHSHASNSGCWVADITGAQQTANRGHAHHHDKERVTSVTITTPIVATINGILGILNTNEGERPKLCRKYYTSSKYSCEVHRYPMAIWSTY